MIEFSVECDLDEQGGMINSAEKFGAGNYLAWNWETKTAIAGNAENNLSGIDTSSFEKTNMLMLGYVAAALEEKFGFKIYTDNDLRLIKKNKFILLTIIYDNDTIIINKKLVL